MTEAPRKYNVLSLFTGAGGLDLGFEQTGRFETLAAVEYQPQFAETLRLNQRNGYFPRMRVIEADILELDPQQVARDCFPDGKVDVIIGGPPCETFSTMGKKQGTKDGRGRLVSTYFSWVMILQPKSFLFENVPALLRVDNGTYWAGLFAELGKLKYDVTTNILNAQEYGCATSRRRIVCHGSTIGPPLEVPKESANQFLSVLDVLSGLPLACDDHESWGHKPVTHTQAVTERFSQLSPGQRDHTRDRVRLDGNKPALALIAGDLTGSRSHIHPIENRELTNRECARIHGFPDEYVFAGSRVAVCKQIANSVPVPLAVAVGKAVAGTLDASRIGPFDV